MCGVLVTYPSDLCPGCKEQNPLTEAELTEYLGRQRRNKVIMVVAALVVLVAIGAIVIPKLMPPTKPANTPDGLAAYVVDRINDGRLKYLDDFLGPDFVKELIDDCQIREPCKSIPMWKPLPPAVPGYVRMPSMTDEYSKCIKEHEGHQDPRCTPKTVKDDWMRTFVALKANGYTPCRFLRADTTERSPEAQFECRGADSSKTVSDHFRLYRYDGEWRLTACHALGMSVPICLNKVAQQLSLDSMVRAANQ